MPRQKKNGKEWATFNLNNASAIAVLSVQSSSFTKGFLITVTVTKTSRQENARESIVKKYKSMTEGGLKRQTHHDNNVKLLYCER
eukprot:CAMPEP_0172503246 /NCGR_PEP_ID=MMETSP1066-20121228/167609_1 /TAXON_ID=671091 /ORGANISM="Coscinodiscus wailesii, Strain CCMP2513" /LENGTH=84 /DNA_ID=CAMNT_0013278911 /DNA_START=91 /DNA_END=341 /DNA_ORIENTATION=-